jgi:hypothetical protein
VEEVFAGLEHRIVLWDADMPQPFEARLVVDGWQRYNALVVLALEGELRTPRARGETRARPRRAEARNELRR